MGSKFEITSDPASDYRTVLRRTDDGCSIPAGTEYHLYHVTVEIPAPAAAAGAAKTLSLYVLAPDEEHAKAQASSWDRENPELIPDLAYHCIDVLERHGVKFAATRVPFRVRGWGDAEF